MSSPKLLNVIAETSDSSNPTTRSVRSSLSTQALARHDRYIRSLREAFSSQLVICPVAIFAGLHPEGLDDPELAPSWSRSFRSLAVYPTSDYGFDFWVVNDASPQVAPGCELATVVYLYVKHFPGHAPSVSLGDSILWVEGCRINGHAYVSEIFHHDVLVLDDGLIVPVAVTVRPFPFEPFVIPMWVILEHPDEYEILICAPERLGFRATSVSDSGKSTTPPLARCLGISSIGAEILTVIDEL